jgi:hypothetical protein
METFLIVNWVKSPDFRKVGFSILGFCLPCLFGKLGFLGCMLQPHSFQKKTARFLTGGNRNFEIQGCLSFMIDPAEPGQAERPHSHHQITNRHIRVTPGDQEG